MSGFTTGLTRIREPEISSIKSFQEQQRQGNPIGDKGLKAAVDVAELTKTRDGLVAEIAEISLERNRSYKQVASELSVLNKQKRKVLEEIKIALKTLSIFKDARSRGEVSFNEFFGGREDILVKFASLVSSKLDNRAKLMNVRAEDLQKDVGLAEEMYTYSENLLEVAYNRFGEVGEARKRVDFDLEESFRLRKSAEKDFKKISESLNDAKSKLSNAIGVELSAREELRVARAESTRIMSAANKRAKTVDLKALKVLEMEKSFEVREEKLQKMEKRLIDKEQTLQRNAERIRVAAAKAGLSGII